MVPHIAVVGATGAVGEVMRQDLQAISIPAQTDALEALTKMQRAQVSRLLVTDGGHLVGIVSLKDLLRFLNLKLELEGTHENGGGQNHTTADMGKEDRLLPH